MENFIQVGESNRIVFTKNEEGKKYIDIRQYFMSENGEWLPTKKGIRINESILPAFKEKVFSLLENFE